MTDVSSLHNSTKPVAAGTDTREGSDARQRSTPAATTIAAPGSAETSEVAAPLAASGVEQPATDACPPRASVATIHQQARDAAAEVAYPGPKFNTRDADNWVKRPTVTPVKVIDATPKPDTSWMDRTVACFGMTDIMFPLDRPGSNSRLQAAANVAEAKAVCSSCHAKDKCLTWAEETRPVAGVYGGVLFADGKPVERAIRDLTPKQLDRLKGEAAKRGRPVTNACPSVAAYRRHKRNGEDPCPACLAKVSAYNAERNRNRRGKAS